ncbi:hypothetical protein B7P43_G16078 [Cryptotermes secundus]|uniref:Uncharacterized protein n=1 Tax=Cryptotermes secundus TaxID=105785 RepID=A0A2J7RB75_9NEOP|nr:hypothetical protein B7P43_G16078 [Cryptotermes secundus]
MTHTGNVQTGSGSCIYIFYQNVRGLRTKSVEICNNVCSFDFRVICLTETWLNDSFSSSNLFPDTYAVYRSDRDVIWKYVSQYRKKCNDATHFDVNGVLTHNSRDIGEAFSEHFQSVYVGGTSCPGTIFTGNCFTAIL